MAQKNVKNDSVYIRQLYREETGFRMVSLNSFSPLVFPPF
ncbi:MULTISPECIES: S24 family peptidase [unclassified Streptococcus]|nr:MULTISPECIES: S24 family peptidase [unclassified Streptococcus]